MDKHQVSTTGLFTMLLIAISVAAACLPYSIATQNLVLAGRVVSADLQEWPNDRLVLVFVRGQEVGRDVTGLGEFLQSRQGVHDGFFRVDAPNMYKLTEEDLNRTNHARFPFMMASSDQELYIYHWFDSVVEGSTLQIPVPSKNITYVVKVISGDVASLPQQVLVPGTTRLTKNGDIIVSLDETSEAAQAGAEAEGLKERMVVDGVNYAADEDMMTVNKITVPINNCRGSSTLVQEYSQMQAFIHEYRGELGGGVGFGVPLPRTLLNLQLELQAKYGFEQGQIDSRTVTYRMEAEPGTNQVYVITWQEVWETGTAQVVTETETISVPFRAKTNLIYQIDSMQLPCNE